jgi:hypothetical protein
MSTSKEILAYLLIVRQRIDCRLQIIRVLDIFQKVGTQGAVRIARLGQLLGPLFALDAIE